MRRRLFMVALIAASLCTAMSSRRALAEDPPKPDQLKQMYDDTLTQLKSAQERKTQLAAENEQLKAKLVELQKQLDAAQAQSAELEKQNATLAERSFFFRAHYAAWQEFLRFYPRLQARWQVFFGGESVTPHNGGPVFVDPEWPWSAQS
jgi:septal ring factor EnvC (AmiA/AmiB activator)